MATYEDRLKSVGIQTANLQEMDLTNLSKLSLKVTNGLVLDLHHVMEGCHHCTYYSLKEWLVVLFREEWPVENTPNVKAIRQSVIRLNNRLSRLKKECSTDLKSALISSFLEEEYCLPKVFVKHGKIVKQTSSESSSSCSADCGRNSLLLASIRLSDELSQQSSELERKQEDLAQLRSKMYSKYRNDQKKLKRRDQDLVTKKKEVEDGKKVIKKLKKNLSDQESSVQNMRKQLDRLRHRAAYWKSKAGEIKQGCDDEVVDAVVKVKESQYKFCEEIYALESDNTELQAAIEELMQTTSDITTFENGKYKDSIRSCCYELLSLNVSVRNIESVIRSVMLNIAEKSIGRLPSQTTLCEMMIESLTVAQAQLGEKLSDESKDFFTLHTDGTTKHSEHFGVYDVTTDDTTYSLGLRHVFSGSAKTTLDTLLEILDDLDVVCEKVTGSIVSKTILLKIKNTMSDRHAAEKLFCTMLSDYREEILPDVVSNWESLSDDQRNQLVRMNNFFCGLHYLVGLAECAEASLKLWELIIEDETQQCQPGTSGTQRLIRTACKAFHSRGCEKSGCSIHFRTYLRSLGISNVPLAAFLGNCFNILFYDGAGVFYLQDHFEKYLSNHHNGPLNMLLRAVLADLRVDHYTAGCRALGIIDNIVTGPFWRKLESSTVSVLNLGDVYTKMKIKFDEWSEDASCLLNNEDVLFAEHTNLDGDVGKSLFTTSASDVLTQEALQLLFKSFSATTQRLVLDHLPGGDYHIIEDPQIAAEVEFVPKTNVAPERDFATLDRLLSEKPNASYIALESLLLYSQNKTSEWLNSKTEAERARLLNAAWSLTSVHKANFKKRREEILLKRSQIQKERERERQKKREREVQEKENLTKQLAPYGLWSSVSEVENGLQKLKNKKNRLELLKLQINFRKKVLCQTHHDKTVYYFSHYRKQLTEIQLKQNLLKLHPNIFQNLLDLLISLRNLNFSYIDELNIDLIVMVLLNGTVEQFSVLILKPCSTEYNMTTKRTHIRSPCSMI